MKYNNLKIIIISILMVIFFILPVNAGLRFGVMPDDTAIPLIVAQQEGLFAKNNLEIELVPFNNAIERDSALKAGKIDGTIADIVAAVFYVDGEQGMKITSMADGRFTLLAAPESGISSYKDMQNARIAISSNTIIEYLTDKFFEENNLNYHSLKKVAIPKIPVRLQMLLAGKIKGATLPEPLASLAVSKGAEKIGTTSEIGGAPVIMVFTKQALENKPNEIKAFYKGYSRAVDLVNKNHENYRKLIVNKGRFPAEIKNSFKFIKYQKPRLPEPEMVADVIQWMKENNLLKDELDYDDLIDNQFVH